MTNYFLNFNQADFLIKSEPAAREYISLTFCVGSDKVSVEAALATLKLFMA